MMMQCRKNRIHRTGILCTYVTCVCCVLLQLPPVATPALSIDSSQPVVLPSLSAIPPSLFALTNPSAPIFAGWLSVNESPQGGLTQAVRLEQLSTDYTVTLNDHCYADNRPHVTETANVTCNS